MSLTASTPAGPSYYGLPKAAPAALTGRKILLVEDDAISRLAASTLLRRHGAAVTAAEDGDSALARLRETGYDLVLMDVQLPHRSGLEATRIIRQEISTSLPVIALTAGALPEERERCREAGMNDLIHKPFDAAILLQRISEWLKHRQAGRQAETGPAGGEAWYDLSGLRSVSNGSAAFVRKMIRLFIREMPASAEAMSTALAAGNAGTIRYLAHRMHPAAHHMGIAGLAAIIKKIEGIAAQGHCTNQLGELIAGMDQIIGAVVCRLEREPE